MKLHIETRNVEGFDQEYVCTSETDPISGKSVVFCMMPKDSRSNAALIVRAVNSHEAFKQLVALLDRKRNRGIWLGEVPEGYLKAIEDEEAQEKELRAALAAAGKSIQ